MQVDDEDLSNNSKDRLEPYRNQDLVPLSVLRENAGVSLEGQVEVARLLSTDTDRWYPLLSWRGRPDWDELIATCEMLWNHLLGDNPRQAGAYSHKQLAFRINQLRQSPSISALIRAEIDNDKEQSEDGEFDVNDSVETALAFVRQWAGHHFPRALIALDRIQSVVFGGLGKRPGDYGAFATQVENMFQPPALTALDEFGIPLPTAQRLSPWINPDDDLDNVLARLSVVDVGATGLSAFEQELVEDTQGTLGYKEEA